MGHTAWPCWRAWIARYMARSRSNLAWLSSCGVPGREATKAWCDSCAVRTRRGSPLTAEAKREEFLVNRTPYMRNAGQRHGRFGLRFVMSRRLAVLRMAS
jgi:hypothetical protein